MHAITCHSVVRNPLCVGLVFSSLINSAISGRHSHSDVFRNVESCSIGSSEVEATSKTNPMGKSLSQLGMRHQ